MPLTDTFPDIEATVRPSLDPFGKKAVENGVLCPSKASFSGGQGLSGSDLSIQFFPLFREEANTLSVSQGFYFDISATSAIAGRPSDSVRKRTKRTMNFTELSIVKVVVEI